ncbi:MAG: hypothetical protein HONDAALG_03862 [Gammaproteobacteria bacterium]|nr:hypothetical protein [Gammaproteobacteria bacterium]
MMRLGLRDANFVRIAVRDRRDSDDDLGRARCSGYRDWLFDFPASKSVRKAEVIWRSEPAVVAG